MVDPFTKISCRRKFIQRGCKLKNVSTIVFDLDQTLFDRQEAFNGWLASLPLCDSDRVYLRSLDRNGFGDRNEFFAGFESVSNRSLDQDLFVQELLCFARPDLYLVNLLLQIKSTYSVAILSNGSASSQRAKILSLSLNEVFCPDRIFISEEMGIEKPDCRAFDFVASALGVSADVCLYLGDSQEIDIEPAKKAGWKTQKIKSRSDLIECLVELLEVVPC